MNLSKGILVFVVLAMAASVTGCIDLTGTGETPGAGTGQLVKEDAASNGGNRQPGDAANLDGTQWLLISLNGNNLIDGSRITLNFADGFVNGSAGCNGYRSLIIGTDDDQFKYTATDDGTLIIHFMITEKDCPEPEGVMQQEVAYVEALRNASAYRIIDDRLEIRNASGETTLVFANKEALQADPGDLVDTEWVLTRLNDEGLLEGTNITLNLTDGQASGFAGCNAYGGPYTVTGGGTLTILEIAATAQGCLEPEGVLQQESAYTAALTGADAYRVMGDRLEIKDASGETTLVFTRKEQFPMDPRGLVGTQWQLVSWEGGSPIEGSTITLFFLTESEFGGHAGCRDYAGSYEAIGDDILFPQLGMMGTVEGCPEALMLQESDYTTKLEWVTNYRLAAGQLELLTARGEVLLFQPLQEDVPPGSGSAAPSDLAQARAALQEFFSFLHDQRYEEAIQYYGGDYEILQEWNPTVAGDDHAQLFQNGCVLNGLQCLRLMTILQEQEVSPGQFLFTVEFVQDDGSLFSRGLDSQFTYTVRNVDGAFLVQELPVYVP